MTTLKQLVNVLRPLPCPPLHRWGSERGSLEVVAVMVSWCPMSFLFQRSFGILHLPCSRPAFKEHISLGHSGTSWTSTFDGCESGLVSILRFYSYSGSHNGRQPLLEWIDSGFAKGVAWPDNQLSFPAPGQKDGKQPECTQKGLWDFKIMGALVIFHKRYKSVPLIFVHFSIHKPFEYIQKTAVHVHALEVAVGKGTMYVCLFTAWCMMHDASAAAADDDDDDDDVVVAAVVQVQFGRPWFSSLIGVRLRLRPCWFCCTFCRWDWTCMSSKLGNPLCTWLWLYDVVRLYDCCILIFSCWSGQMAWCVLYHVFHIISYLLIYFIDCRCVKIEREANLNVWLPHLVPHRWI